MTRERDDSGRYASTVTRNGVLGVFDDVDGPVVLTRDVANALDCSTEAARQRLNALVDAGELEKRVSGRTALYWRSETQPPPEPSPEELEPPRTPIASDVRAKSEVLEVMMNDGADALPGQMRSKVIPRREALAAVLERLLEGGEVETGELQDVAWSVDDDTYASKRSLWTNAMTNALREIEWVEKVGGERVGAWRYIGPHID